MPFCSVPWLAGLQRIHPMAYILPWSMVFQSLLTQSRTHAKSDGISQEKHICGYERGTPLRLCLDASLSITTAWAYLWHFMLLLSLAARRISLQHHRQVNNRLILKSPFFFSLSLSHSTTTTTTTTRTTVPLFVPFCPKHNITAAEHRLYQQHHYPHRLKTTILNQTNVSTSLPRH